LILHSNVVETLLSMNVEFVVDQVFSIQCVPVNQASGIVKIHLYVMVVSVLMNAEDVVKVQIAVSQKVTVIVMETH